MNTTDSSTKAPASTRQADPCVTNSCQLLLPKDKVKSLLNARGPAEWVPGRHFAHWRNLLDEETEAKVKPLAKSAQYSRSFF